MKTTILKPRFLIGLLAVIISFYLLSGVFFQYPSFILYGVVLLSFVSLGAMVYMFRSQNLALQETLLGFDFLVIVFLGTLVRLVLAYFYFGNYDMASWEIDAHLGVRGMNVYAHTARYDYAPVWFWILTFLKSLQLRFAGLTFHFVLRAFLTGVDLLLLFLILPMARFKNQSIVKTALFFYLNPVSFLLTGFHGQIENLALLMVAAALYGHYKLKDKTVAAGWIWFFSTLALLIKHNILYEVVTLLKYAARRLPMVLFLLALAIGVFLLSFIPYWHEGKENIIHHVLLYKSREGRYGLTSFFNFPRLRELFILGVVLYPLSLKKKDILQECLLGALFFLVFTSGIGIQYFVLPIIFGALRPSPAFLLYSCMTTLFILGMPLNLYVKTFQLIPFYGWNMVWVAAIFWFIKEQSGRFANKLPSHA